MERPNYRQVNEGASIDYGRYLRLVLKNWYWFIITISLAITASYIINIVASPQYSGYCNIVIGDDPNAPVMNQGMVGAMTFNQLNPINKEIGIIQSKQLALETLEKLDFDISYYHIIKGKYVVRSRYQKLPFLITSTEDYYNPQRKKVYVKLLSENKAEVHIEGDSDDTKEVNFGDFYIEDNFKFRILKSIPEFGDDLIGSEFYFYFNNRSQLANLYRTNTSVNVNQTSRNILNLRLIGDNPYKIINYLNTLCSTYISNDMDLRNRMANNTISFIDSQLGILNKQLKEAEQKLILYRRENKIYTQSIDEKTVAELFKLETEFQRYEDERQTLKEFVNKIDSVQKGYNHLFPDHYGDAGGMLGGSLAELNNLIVERKILLKNESGMSPAIKTIEQKIEVKSEVIKTYINNRIIYINDKKLDIHKNITNLEYEMMDIPAEERHLNKLQRDFELAENIFNMYQQKRIEAVLAKASTVSKIRVLDPATLETVGKIKPQKKQTRQMALVIGLLLPLTIIVLKETLSSVIHSESEIRNKLNIPIIGKLPHSTIKSTLVTNDYPASSIAEAFRSMLARLEVNTELVQQQILSITSGSSGEGKTFTSVNLSIILSKRGKKTLIIGLDLRRPQLHKLLGTDNKVGLTTYLTGRSKKEDIIIETEVDNLYFIPSGPIPPNPVELIQNNKLEKLLKELRQEYEYIIIDTPPLGMVADAMLINRYTDINFFIIRMDQSKRSILSYIDELNKIGTFRHLNLVLNDISGSASYGYGGKTYKYYYYHKNDDTIIKKVKKRVRKQWEKA